MQALTTALIEASKSSVELAIGLVGVMAFFLGLSPPINIPTPRKARMMSTTVNSRATINVGRAAKRIKGSATGSPLIIRPIDPRLDGKNKQERL
jgi:hypothetical protein